MKNQDRKEILEVYSSGLIYPVVAYNLQFFAKDGPGGEKTEPATPKKLNETRENGQVAKSKELIMAISLLALFIIIKIYIGNMGEKLISTFKDFYSSFDVIVGDSSKGYPVGLACSTVGNMFMSILNIVVPILLIAVVISVLGNMLQQSWKVTAKPMKPKLNKISPLSGFKRIFSVRQLLELLKSIAMMTIIGIVVYTTIMDKVGLLLSFYDITLYAALSTIGEIIIELGIKISMIFLIIGFIDLMYQKHKFKEDTKMTKQEVKDEYKNAEGDPQVKSQVRRRMMEVSRRRMMQQLPEADVVITNPTHFAVALKYEPDSGMAPVVIAKGADHLAFQIKDRARECNVAIVENKPLARILYHNVDIGMEIPPELYQAVAEILANILRPIYKAE
ncbi:MAG: flagellar biosynthesis protein FlhB [Lachnospira sp.]|nr:flagellar biosynthesis protein FlhB [Lachnospira sp.]